MFFDNLNCNTMISTTTDNCYPVGMRVFARAHPAQPLLVHAYYNRIYYCALVDDPQHSHYAYFEDELIPAGSDQPNP
jgi:hypothetical protein